MGTKNGGLMQRFAQALFSRTGLRVAAVVMALNTVRCFLESHPADAFAWFLLLACFEALRSELPQ